MEKIGFCKRCNRALKTAKSIEKGAGPACLKKLEAEKVVDEPVDKA